MKTFEQKLTESIKEVGLWLVDNAPEIASPIPARTGVQIRIDYNWEEISPEIQIENRYLCPPATEKLNQNNDGQG